MGNNAVDEMNPLTLEDFFADMDPQIPYHEEHLDFLGFLDPSVHGEAETTNSPMMIHPQFGIQQNPSIFGINEFAPITVDTHPGIVIPANITPETPLRHRTIAEPSQKRLIHPQIQSQPNASKANQASANPTVGVISSEAVSRRMRHGPMNKKQLQIMHWTLDATAPTGTPTTPLSKGISRMDVPIIQSKSMSRTAGIKRRKNSSSSASESLESPVKPDKTSHNMIEKRYRLKLNDKILSLRNAVPAIRSPTLPTGEQSVLDTEHAKISNKLNKGTVLTKATEYIHQLEQEKKALEQEVAILKAQLAARKPDTPKKQDFELGGVAAASSVTHDNGKSFTISNNGMMSPESCISLMSPEAEGIIFGDVADVSELSSMKSVIEW